MTCSGCPRAATRILKKNAQVKGFELFLDSGKATVESDNLSQSILSNVPALFSAFLLAQTS
ncbi:hypothetical protein DFQ27_007621 [Actinomortierella ambigua]|uniref:HMA domain-containing protein n=1 Tax=Actinomortierella ambigua TaxID=1343610 RepID=A0A9P6PVX4_9FUNG|nr:hypothetical protein DFQ27_007621 [Actinomortierella ambigua]